MINQEKNKNIVIKTIMTKKWIMKTNATKSRENCKKKKILIRKKYKTQKQNNKKIEGSNRIKK